MGDNKNSAINIFGKISNLFQSITSRSEETSNVDVKNDIEFIIKDISGKIGDLSLSPENASNLTKKLDELKNSEKNKEKKTVLEEIKKIIATSGSAIVSKGITAAIDTVIPKII